MKRISLSICATALGLFAVLYFLDMTKTQNSTPVQALQATECGAAGEPCRIRDRRYNIALPKGDGPFPVFLFFHGSGGSGDNTIAQQSLINPAIAKKYAFIAPSAQIIRYDNGTEQNNWVWQASWTTGMTMLLLARFCATRPDGFH